MTAARRALVIPQPGSLALEERAPLSAGRGEVLVRPRHVGVCGTDLELLQGSVDPAFVRYPLVLGHEWAGIVEDVGPGVAGLAPGDRVVAEGIVPCGTCPACRRGATNVCATYDEVGFTRDGAASDQIVLPGRLVHRLAEEATLLDGALVEPTAVVLQGLTKIGPRPGDEVLVLGDGTIALLVAHLAGLWSPARIVVRGLREEQRRLAAAVGAGAFATEEPGDDFDLVIEAAGAPAAVLEALRRVRRGGRVLLLGYAGAEARVPFPLDDVVNGDLTLCSSFGYTSSAWEGVVGLLNAGRIRPAAVVTHRIALDDHARAFDALAAPVGERGKIILDV
jgi:2-desacetyl-2-hydroxyethyl bacteriochlorophyllide A dehydrogenase